MIKRFYLLVLPLALLFIIPTSYAQSLSPSIDIGKNAVIADDADIQSGLAK